MIFRELSNAVFRFVLRCAGAEIDGGCSNTPPSRSWKIQRPSRARANKVYAVGKSVSPCDVTQISPLRPSEQGFKIGHFPPFTAISLHLAAFHKTIRTIFSYEPLVASVSCIRKALAPRKFQQYCTVVQWGKGIRSPR